MPISSRRTGAAAAAGPEFELLDTGVFDDDRYFDVTVEYAKAAPDDILMRVTVENRGPRRRRAACAAAALGPQHLVLDARARRGRCCALPAAARSRPMHPDAAGTAAVLPLQPAELLFCENETNTRRLFGSGRAGPLQGRHQRLRRRMATRDAVNPLREGTKCAALHHASTSSGGRAALRFALRLRPRSRGRRVVDGLRRAVRRPPRGGRRVLRHSAAATSPIRTRGWCSGRRSPACSGPSSSTTSTCARWLAGDPAQPPPPPEPPARPQQRLAASEQRRHHLDAGQVGISLVRRLGPRLPLRHLRADRPGIRQAAARAADARMVHAPERPAARL